MERKFKEWENFMFSSEKLLIWEMLTDLSSNETFREEELTVVDIERNKSNGIQSRVRGEYHHVPIRSQKHKQGTRVARLPLG